MSTTSHSRPYRFTNNRCNSLGVTFSPKCARSPSSTVSTATSHKSSLALLRVTSRTFRGACLDGLPKRATDPGPVIVRSWEVPLVPLVILLVSHPAHVLSDLTRPLLALCLVCRLLCTLLLFELFRPCPGLPPKLYPFFCINLAKLTCFLTIKFFWNFSKFYCRMYLLIARRRGTATSPV